VIDNVAYGLWARGARRRSARAQVQPLLERLDLWPLRDRLPAALSGGEAQRVALARALAPEPRLLVLDEPLSALDVESRPRTRGLLQRALAEFSGPRLVITHDPLEALLLADHLVVLEGGRVSQAGPTDSVRRHPATRYVATLAGVNLLEGLLEIRAGERALATHGLLLGLGPDANALAAGAALRATVHPGAVHLSQTAPPGDGANTWQAQVETLELEGDRVRIRLTRPEGFFAELTANAIELRSFAPGTQVFATVSPKDIYFYT
jgi:molybdate transport system ATP-binding protein